MRSRLAYTAPHAVFTSLDSLRALPGPSPAADGLRRLARTVHRQPGGYRETIGAAAGAAAGGPSADRRAAAGRGQPWFRRRPRRRPATGRGASGGAGQPEHRLGAAGSRRTARRHRGAAVHGARSARQGGGQRRRRPGADPGLGGRRRRHPAAQRGRSGPEDRRGAHQHSDRAGAGRPQQPVQPPREGDDRRRDRSAGRRQCRADAGDAQTARHAGTDGADLGRGRRFRRSGRGQGSADRQPAGAGRDPVDRLGAALG